MRGPRLSLDPARIGAPSLRPSGQWTPARLGSKVLWLRAASLATDTSSVSTWSDESGAENHATQGTEAKKPTYTASWRNGKPAVSFNGSRLLSVASSLTGATGWTVAMVGQFSSLSGQRCAIGIGDTAGYGLMANGAGSGKREVIVKGVLFDTDSNATTSAEYWVATCTAGGTLSLYINGSPVALTNTSPAIAAPNTSSAIGCLRTSDELMKFSGYIGEIVVMSAAIGASDISLLHGYFAAEYAI